MASLVTALLTVAVAASALQRGVACHDHKRSRAVPSAEQTIAISAARSRMHIGSRGIAAPLGRDRFEAHNPLEYLQMHRLRVKAEPAVRLTANVTELRRSG